MALFEGRELACRRGGRLVFSGLDFALNNGQALLLTGPNGSGKSSLLRMMAGLLRPVAGEILFDGNPRREDPEVYSRALHYLGHLEAIKPMLSVLEQVEAWSGLHGGAPKDPVEALRAQGLEELAPRSCRLLSAGQRRRLALSRLSANDAKLWLLDEPTLGLDQAACERLAGVIEAHRREGGIVIAATHLDLGLKDAQTLALDSQAQPELAELDW